MFWVIPCGQLFTGIELLESFEANKRMDEKMRKPVCLVTGVGPRTGTGGEIAARFAAGGYQVAMLARDGNNLATLEEEIEGASQRIQEDCNRFARIVESLGLQVVREIITLVAFVPVLWALSDSVTIPFFSDIQGSLVWTALSVSICGLIISLFVGYRLPGLEYNNQKVEAAFRKELVYGGDDRKNYCLLYTSDAADE